MTNLDSIFKNRDITLPTKFRLVKAMGLPVNNGKRITLNCKALLFQAVVVHISLLHFPDLPESQGTCCHLLLTGAQGHDTWTPTCV